MKYTKKQITVEALQWDGQNHRAMFEFLGGKENEHLSTGNNNFYIDHNRVERGLIIKTSEGDMAANVGDYIVKEPFDKERKYYPVKAHIFELTYGEYGTVGVSPLEMLKEMQNGFGYVKGNIDPVALLGLFGEAGEVLNETFLIDNSEDEIKSEDIKLIAVKHAKHIDYLKKQIRNKTHKPITITVENQIEFDKELADCFYYLHALAINRGLSLETLAYLCIAKINSKKEQATG